MTLQGRLEALAAAIRTKINAMMPRLLPPGGAAGQILSKSSGTDYSTGWVNPPSGSGGGSSDPLLLPTEYDTTSPTTPASGTAIFSLKRGGRMVPGWKGPDGRVQRIQAALGGNNIYWDRANWGLATTTALGVAWTGTLTAVAGPTSGYLTSLPRGTMTIATATGMIERRTNVNFLNREAVWGGYQVHMRWGIAAMANVARCFFGLVSTAAGTAMTNVDPTTLLNIIGIGKNSADTALSIIHNDGTGAATKTALPNTGSLTNIVNATFQLDLFTVPGGTSIGVRVQRFNNDGTATVDELVISTDLPAANTWKGVRYWMGNTTAVALTMAYVGTYVETD